MWASMLRRRQPSPPPLTIQAPWAWSPLAKKAITIAALAGLLFVLIGGLALAGDPTGASTGAATDVVAKTAGSPTTGEIAAELGHVKISLNMFFLIFGGALVFFMQAGFAMVETGFCRSKNAVHVIMTNFVIFAIGVVVYWAVGYAFQFGGAGTFPTLGGTQPLGGLASASQGWGLIGHQGFFLAGRSYDVAIIAMFFFQMVFMDTAATIPTGAMAERWKFSAFVVYGAFMAAIVYPIYGNWIWGGGWLSALGRNVSIGHGAIDFAGSGVVHAVGGFVALAGAMVLGPRIGKFGKDGKPRAILGHNIPMAILGTHHLGVRLDRLQRGVHPRRDGFALQRDHRQHIHLSLDRLSGRDVPGLEGLGQARPLHDRQRHARRPCGDHRVLRVRQPGRGSRHRHRSRRSWWWAVSSSLSATSKSMTPWEPSRSTGSTVCGALSPWVSSPMAATARVGTE